MRSLEIAEWWSVCSPRMLHAWLLCTSVQPPLYFSCSAAVCLCQPVIGQLGYSVSCTEVREGEWIFGSPYRWKWLIPAVVQFDAKCRWRKSTSLSYCSCVHGTISDKQSQVTKKRLCKNEMSTEHTF